MKIEPNNCYNIDCEIGMKLMQEQGLKADWCITDPPYGINFDNIYESRGGTQAKTEVTTKRFYKAKNWDNVRINDNIITLMRECSENQIIFGGNYYADILPPTKSWVVWNKRQKGVHNDFADCELAWSSFGQARVFHYEYMGMIQGDMKNKDDRFHPTQKPTQIWCMLLNYYTKENDLILDPFAGSQSLRIACHKLKRRYIGFEIDKEYYEKGCEWYKKSTQQVSMFDLV
jgi:site-specific DNA-methyltransferase (adenine-specific)